ncbi:MAG: gliding motility-associated C-terminal domain-containing protein [Bacteroidales bacterium]
MKKIFILCSLFICTSFVCDFLHATNGITILSPTICSTQVPLHINGQLYTNRESYISILSITDNFGNSYSPDGTVSPTKTTTYFIEYKNQNTGTTKTENAVVTIVYPPKLSINREHYIAQVCEGSTVTLSLDTLENIERNTLEWVLSTGGTSSEFMPTFTITKNANITVTARNNTCGEIASDKLIYFAKTKPKFKYKILDLSPITVCVDCPIDYPLPNEIEVSAGTPIFRTLTWIDTENPIVSSYPRVVNGHLLGHVDSTNECGTTNLLVDTTIKLKIIGTPCTPVLYPNLSTTSCICTTVGISVTNPYTPLCSFNQKDIHILWNATTVNFLNEQNSLNKKIFNYNALPLKSSSFSTEINYTLSCPSKSSPTLNKQIARNTDVTIDSCISASYFYCYGDTAYLSFITDASKDIKNVKILPPHDILFSLNTSSNKLYLFASKDVVLDSLLYTPLQYQITYKLIECKQDIDIIKSISLKEDFFCKPQLYHNYPPTYAKEQYSCIGDANSIGIYVQNRTIVFDSLVISQGPYQIGNFQNNQGEEAYRSMEYSLFPYYEQYFRDILVTAYYTQKGLSKSTSKTFPITAISCPPKIYKQTSYGKCPGSENRFDIMASNPTTKRESFTIKTLCTPSCTLFDTTSQNLQSRWHYYFSVAPFTNTELKMILQYNEGDSLKSMELSSSFFMNDTCFPYGVPDQNSTCIKDSLHLYIDCKNVQDTLVKVIWDNSSPCRFHLINKEEYPPISNRYRLHYYTFADTNGIYPYVVQVKNRDTLLSYPDTLKLHVILSSKAFVTDTAYVCTGSDIDLSPYIDTTIVQFIKEPTSLFFRNVQKNITLSVVAQSKFHCANMDIYNTFQDSILINADLDVYLSGMNDTVFCMGDSISLKAPTNGRVTWVRETLPPSLYSKDTLVTNLLNYLSFCDTIRNSNTRYTAISSNTCPIWLSKSFLVKAKSLPHIFIEPKSRVCLYDTIHLKAQCSDSSPLSSYWTHNGFLLNSPHIVLTTKDSSYAVIHIQGSNQCWNQDSSLLLAYLPPLVQISDGNNSICVHPKRPTLLQAKGADSYQWLIKTPVNTPNLNINIHTDSIFQVVGIENLHQCKDTAKIKCLLYVPDINTSDTTLCVGTQLLIKVDSLPKSKFLWSINHLILSNSSILNIENVHDIDTGSYFLYTNRYFCKDTQILKLQTYSTPNPKIQTENLRFCEGISINLSITTALSPIEENNMQIWWFTPRHKDGLPGGKHFSLSSTILSDSGWYKVKVKLGSCSSTDSVFLSIDSHSHPSFNLRNFYCNGEDLALEAYPKDKNASYHWFSSNRNIYSSNSDTLLPNLQKEDSTKLYLEIQRYSCCDTTFRMVSVRPRIDPSLHTSSFHCESSTATITAENAENADQKQWYFQNTILPGENTSTLHIPNVNFANQGWYSFISSLKLCNSYKDSIYLKINPLPIPILAKDTFFCMGDTLILNAYNAQSPEATFVWNTGIKAPSISITTQGNYWLTMTLNGCKQNANIAVTSRPKPIFSLGADTVLCRESPLILKGPDGYIDYLWQDGSTMPYLPVQEDGIYRLTITQNACSYSSSRYVHFRFCGTLFFASAFTPNGDGINDKFGVFTNAKPEDLNYRLIIFDRSGKIVFSTTNISDSWDGFYKGQACLSGVYVFRCIAYDKENKKDLSVNGQVTIIR